MMVIKMVSPVVRAEVAGGYMALVARAILRRSRLPKEITAQMLPRHMAQAAVVAHHKLAVLEQASVVMAVLEQPPQSQEHL